LRRPDLQRWLLQLEAVRYAPHTTKPQRSGADFRRQIATLQRDIKRLLPVRMP
jgi:hypothetical protein